MYTCLSTNICETKPTPVIDISYIYLGRPVMCRVIPLPVAAGTKRSVVCPCL